MGVSPFLHLLKPMHSSRSIIYWLRRVGVLLTLTLAAAAARAQLPDTLDLGLVKVTSARSHYVATTAVPLLLVVQVTNRSQNLGAYGAYTLRCRVNTGTPRDTLVTLAVRPGGFSGRPYYWFQLWNLPVGRHVIKIWGVPPTGTTDPNPLNDTLVYTTRVVPPAQSTARRALVEEFTATTCGPCATYAPHIERWLHEPPQDTAALAVAYQQDFPAPGCYYQNPSSVARRLAANIVGVPFFQLNRAYPTFLPWAGFNTLIGELYAPAFVRLEATYERDSVTGQFTVWPVLTPLAEFDATQRRPTFGVAWVEPSVPAFQATNGQDTLHNVSHFTQSNWGAPVTFGAVGVPIAVPPATYTPAPADHVQNPARLVPIVWATSVFGPDGVLQAVRARRRSPVGVAPAVAAGRAVLRLAPNPARHETVVTGLPAPAAGQSAAPVQLFDGLGRLLRTVPGDTPNARLDVRGLPAGVYTVRVAAATRRLVIE